MLLFCHVFINCLFVESDIRNQRIQITVIIKIKENL